jgi:DNA-binding LacI/PurR family transcriptional regulator
MRRYRKPTIKDVAQHAGVSPTTVSVFVSGREDVCSSETADRIRVAVTALRYTPNSLSRGLRLNAMRTLGVCVGIPSAEARRQARDSFVERLLRGIATAADSHDYSLLQYPTSVRNADTCDALLDGRVDGVIFSASHQDTRPMVLRRSRDAHGCPYPLALPPRQLRSGICRRGGHSGTCSFPFMGAGPPAYRSPDRTCSNV